ncbi:MAG: glycerate kinase [Candidatus Hydrogenedentota bacterium]
MHVVLAPDSFKNCLPAKEAAEALGRGVHGAAPNASLDHVPLADGGEGTVDALVAAADGQRVSVTVTGPLGEPVEAVYGVLNGETAVIEMAAASGHALLTESQRDPRAATTYGTGQLIAHALDNGYRDIIVGIGGSATNDAGAGMAQALGYRLLDPSGLDLSPGGAALTRIARIDAAHAHPALTEASIRAACDVRNPLCGPDGASRVYGPQKGADAQTVAELDAALHRFGEIIEEQLGVPVLERPGAGAAGGLGAGLVAFCGAELEPGFDVVARAVNLEERIAAADLVLTGEGLLDAQTRSGKTPAGVAALAKRHGVPAIAIAGALEPGYESLHDAGLTAAFSLCNGPMTLEEALRNAAALLEATAFAVIRVWNAGSTGFPA